MNRVALLLLLFIGSTAHSQILLNPLKKYSYYLTGSKSNYAMSFTMAGTAFFIRQGNSLYLITAKHIINGCVNNQKQPFYPETIFIWLHDSSNTEGIAVPIDISKIRDTLKCPTLPDDADVIALKMSDIRLNNVYSVEKYLSPIFSKVADIEIFGFPENNTPTKIAGYTNPSNLHIPSNKYQIVRLTDTNTGMVDNKNLYIFSTAVRLDNTLGGYSGSPIFIKDGKSKNWRLLGVMFGHNGTSKPEDKYIAFATQDYLQLAIKEAH
jgi:hypothetical protein